MITQDIRASKPYSANLCLFYFTTDANIDIIEKSIFDYPYLIVTGKLICGKTIIVREEDICRPPFKSPLRM